MKLHEGDTHPFHVLKRETIPEQGEFFVLRHASGRRLLLPCGAYEGYGIAPGQTITCRVARVSCTGRVSLEPVHPCYRAGGAYDFEVIQWPSGRDNTLAVRDCLGNRLQVAWPEGRVWRGPRVRLRVIALSRGIPELHAQEAPTASADAPNPGDSHHFTLKRTSKNIYNEDVYILVSDRGWQAELRVKHYRPYGLTWGQAYRCQVIGEAHPGVWAVEPQHPAYKPNGAYWFEVIRVRPAADGRGAVLLVRDALGRVCPVPMPTGQAEGQIIQGPRALCRVGGFDRGRPQLTLAWG